MKRPLIMLTAGFTLSLVILCFFVPQYALYTAVFCIFGAALYVALPFAKEKRAVAAVLFGMILGCLLWEINESFVYGPVVDKYAGAEGFMTGIVCTYPEKMDGYSRLYVRVRDIDGGEADFKIRLYVENEEGIEPGAIISFYGRLKQPAEYWYFSNARYIRTKRVFLTVSSENVWIYDAKPVWWSIPLRAAGKLSARLNELMPDKDAALMMALILGDGSNLEAGFENDLRKTGLSHIVAVSGMNVALMVSIILAVFGRKRGNLVAIPAICFFALMAGLTASVVRAGIMQIIGIAAYRTERKYDSLTSMAAASGIMFAINPYSIADVGLWMSFLASLGLTVVYSPAVKAVRSKVRVRNRIIKRLFDLICSAVLTTLSAQLFVLPLQVMVFGRLSVIAVFANALCVWAAEFAFFIGLAASAISLVWYAGGMFAAHAAVFLTGYVYFVVEKLASLPGADVNARNIYIVTALVLVYGLMILAFTVFRSCRYEAVLCSAVIFVTAVGMVHMEKHNTVEISIRDCGNTQSVIIRNGGEALAVNCGSAFYLEKALSDMSVDCVDTLILTDYRNSSAGEAEKILRDEKIGTLVLPMSDSGRRDEICLAAEGSGAEILDADSDGEILFGSCSVKYYVNCSGDADDGRLALFISCGNVKVIALNGIYPENLYAVSLRMGNINGAYAAAGDFYISRAVPSRLAAGIESVIITGFYPPDPISAGWMTRYGTDVRYTQRSGSLTFTVPQK